MTESRIRRPTRRDFLQLAVALIAVESRVLRLWSVAPATVMPSPADAAIFDAVSTYRSLSRNQAAFVEAMVNILCPADRLTPNGVSCGLALFIDQQLAGNFGDQQCRRWPVTRERFFKDGIAAANMASQDKFGVRFDQLDPSNAGVFLRDIAAGRVIDAYVPLDSWSNELVDPLLVQACFAGPIYERYGGKVFWKLFAHAGASGVSADNQRRG